MKLSLNQQEVVEFFCLFLLGLVGQVFVEAVVDYIIPADDHQQQLIVWSAMFGVALILTIASRVFLLETSEHRHLVQYAETYRKLDDEGFFNNAGSKHVLQQQQLRWGATGSRR